MGGYGEPTKITDDEKSETENHENISREFDLGSVKRGRGNRELTCEPRTEQDKSRFIGGLAMSREVHFVTGSSYDGSWDALGMAGVGKYVFANGTIYEGEIRDGMFHGHGSLYWSENHRLDVVHLRGELVEHRYVGRDGPVDDIETWKYCKFPDRRFHESIKNGLKPGGRALKTARQSATILPSGCYDTGDGVFDPRTQLITSYSDPKKVLRLPTNDECNWIVAKCRRSWTEPTGYRPDLNENWSEDPPELPYDLPMSLDSPDHWWKRLATFARDRDVLAPSAEDSSTSDDVYPPEVCVCGNTVIIGKPCDCILDVSAGSENYEISESTVSEDPSSFHGSFTGESRQFRSTIQAPTGSEDRAKWTSKESSVENWENDEQVEDLTSKSISPENSEGNIEIDYTSGSIPGEKVTGEPEMSYYRSSELRLREANASEENLDRESVETEKIGKKSDPVDVDDSTSEMVLVKESTIDSIEKLKTPKNSDQPESPISGSESVEEIGFEESSMLEFDENDLVMEESKKTSSKSFNSKLSESENEMENGKSRSVVDSFVCEDPEGPIASEYDETSLDKVHPSLATLVSTKHETSEKKDIVEDCRCQIKEKPKNLQMGTSVWQLSSAKKNYGPKTKIENLLFHPALTAPRSDNVKYVRKPCNSKVCKKIKDSAKKEKTDSPCSRKEHSSDLQAKCFRSSGRLH